MRTSLVDSSRTSTSMGSFLPMMTSAMRSTRSALLTLYGIDVTTMRGPPRLASSIFHSPRR